MRRNTQEANANSTKNRETFSGHLGHPPRCSQNAISTVLLLAMCHWLIAAAGLQGCEKAQRILSQHPGGWQHFAAILPSCTLASLWIYATRFDATQWQQKKPSNTMRRNTQEANANTTREAFSGHLGHSPRCPQNAISTVLLLAMYHGLIAAAGLHWAAPQLKPQRLFT